jgi:voltage-dependent calcium channel L type alpha-1S
MIVLFKMSTGEDWPLIMYDTMNTDSNCISGINCGTKLAPLYFFSFTMICNYVMLNLFILVIIQQFELYYLVDDNILQKFRDDLSNFKKTWGIFSREF